jgi:hypothetical protein
MFALCAMGLVGCGPTWQQRLARTAAVQHNCPITRVRVLTRLESVRTYAVLVCDERRVYQRAGRGYIDQTPDGVSQPAAPAAGSAVVSASPATQEPAFSRFVRTRIDWYRAQILACTGGPTAVVAEWTEGPVRISVRGESDVAVAQCVVSAIGTIEVPRGTVQGRLIHPIAP